MTFDGKIPPLPHCSPVVIVILLPLLPIPCPVGTLVPVPRLQDRVRGPVGCADIRQPPHCPSLQGEGRDEDGGENCCCRRCQDDPDPPQGCIGDGPKGATTAGHDAHAHPPTLTAAIMAAAVAAGCCACCCRCWRRRRRGDNATVMTATTATTMAMTLCTVTAVSTATAARATARAPRRNCRCRLCIGSYFCSHALSFCVSCFFDWLPLVA